MIVQWKPSGLIKFGSLTLATVFAASVGCSDVRVESIEKGAEQQETGVEMPPAMQPPTIACAAPRPVKTCTEELELTSPNGDGDIFNCDTKEVLHFAPAPEPNELTCEKVSDACDDYAAAHPGESVGCFYRNAWIYRRELSPGACSPPSSATASCADPCAVGKGEGWTCKPDTHWLGFSGSSLSCAVTVRTCWLFGYLRPGRNIECTFDGQPIYSYQEPGGVTSDHCPN
jgi:hypothetical protein